MNSGIYSLIARNTLNNEAITIPIKELNGADTKYKVNISSIDKLTTYFENEQQLSKRLFDRKYIPFPNADIFIRYKQDSVYHDLEVLYKDYEKFRNLTNEKESTISLTNTTFISGYDSFFCAINDKQIRNYLLNSHNVNLKLKEDITNLYNSKQLDQVNFYKRKIVERLSNYRVFRNLTQTIQEYYNPKIKQDRIQKREDRRSIILDKTPDNEEVTYNQVTMNQYLNDKQSTINIEIPSDYSIETNKEENNKLASTKIENENMKTYYKDGGVESVMEGMDLDEILSLPKEDLQSIGINKDAVDDYSKIR